MSGKLGAILDKHAIQQPFKQFQQFRSDLFFNENECDNLYFDLLPYELMEIVKTYMLIHHPKREYNPKEFKILAEYLKSLYETFDNHHREVDADDGSDYERLFVYMYFTWWGCPSFGGIAQIIYVSDTIVFRMVDNGSDLVGVLSKFGEYMVKLTLSNGVAIDNKYYENKFLIQPLFISYNKAKQIISELKMISYNTLIDAEI